ncbi:type I-E CRISPR-associated protein Cas7/Cse4/CasC [Meiothermus hypogaeus]|uniref:Type I-E CRISPR-associated protein Cas7/Cse4/CasC n=2 Tax=Meiothermus hypogaeus TaxID=884155 RepID=A0A511QXJ1_9DEIN|nr:type I-E CRISPR-associated protein Cas7/Cse4/CasC [Meiothermus hypogaeus]RIH74694.1 CRISPR system Cascade subunit CasC [Meiothermus hypogaeus]GEM82095.1 type I-E CRISPR-associated protein Cas7/Cse4/CasC [Meiothermus hypogaeus NBRC 106114]GIW36409.1 MAG: type I-E CRISPR-associated protein Cas7/Cse4/CasC [Meiothermus sp.]
MKALLEIHLLQNFAPSNLNRDDTGSPKDAYFGGVRRGRISSQSLKRAMRMYFREQKLIPEEHLAVRTKRLTEKLAELLEAKGHPKATAVKAINLALGGVKLKVDDADNKTQYLVYLGSAEIEKIAELIHGNWQALEAAIAAEESGKKKDKKAAKEAVPEELVRVLEKVMDGGKAVDLALFGRMLADLPEKNQYAACQVAHAISTHKVEHNEDFYTAVDDLKPDDNAGADMLGTVEFNSACYYRYAVMDLEKLRSNLQGDDGLMLRGLEAFLRSSIYALPSGKQNSFAAHQLPSFIGFTVRTEASPRSLANAFEKPVKASQEGWLNASAQALVSEWNDLERVFGQGGTHRVINRTEAKLEGKLEGAAVGDVETLVKETLEQVKRALGLEV